MPWSEETYKQNITSNLYNNSHIYAKWKLKYRSKREQGEIFTLLYSTYIKGFFFSINALIPLMHFFPLIHGAAVA